MSWNYRILAHKHKDDVFFRVHEVYYDENGKPNGYTENPATIGAYSTSAVEWAMKKMQECKDKPVLWAGELFPSVCTIIISLNQPKTIDK